MLIEKISGAQGGNQADMLYLIEKFNPLLKHYGYRLHREDSYNDMVLAFIELIIDLNTDRLQCKDDRVIVRYIAVSVKNKYIKYLKELMDNKINEVSWDSLPERDMHQALQAVENPISYDNREQFLKILQKLTQKERYVLQAVFWYGYSSAHIAKQLNVTRQNINQTKLRAIQKVRSYWET